MQLDTLLLHSAEVPEISPEAMDSARAVLDAELAHQTALTAQRARATRTRIRIGAAAAAAAALIIVPTIGLNGNQPGASAAAAAVLRHAGQAAGEQPGGWPNEPYWRSVSRYQRGGHAVTREIWIGHKSMSVLRDPGVGPGVIGLGTSRFPAGSGSLSWDQLYALPTDPGALADALRNDIKGAGLNDDAELFVIVGDLLRESPAPPALRKALYEVAANIPGITLVGTVTDSDGRVGQALERDGQRYVIDPSTGRLLQESEANGAWTATYEAQGPAVTAPTATSR